MDEQQASEPEPVMDEQQASEPEPVMDEEQASEPEPLADEEQASEEGIEESPDEQTCADEERGSAGDGEDAGAEGGGDSPNELSNASAGDDAEENPSPCCAEHGASSEPSPALGDSRHEDVQNNSDAESLASSDSHALTATTLEMGKSPSSDSNQRDSQVSSGWLGKAYTYYNKQDQKQKEKDLEELKKLRASRKNALDELTETLEKEMGVEVSIGYARWCKRCLDQYGDFAFEHLCELDTYYGWLDAEKEDMGFLYLFFFRAVRAVLRS